MADMINHPPHYVSPSGLESIDVIEAFELGFNLGNVVKYVLRAGRKGEAATDLRKARWYLERQIASLEPERESGVTPDGSSEAGQAPPVSESGTRATHTGTQAAHPAPPAPSEGSEREVERADIPSRYWNARTCVCGESSGTHRTATCNGFDPDWKALRRSDEELDETIERLQRALSEAQERESEQVSDALDPSVGVPWMRCSPGLPDYVRGMEAEIARLSDPENYSPSGEGVACIARERRRQVIKEGWTPEHDDGHWDGEMALAASAYALHAAYDRRPGEVPSFWPWSKDWWKPTSRLRCLEKAGALIAAEIDRLLRATVRPPESEGESDHG